MIMFTRPYVPDQMLRAYWRGNGPAGPLYDYTYQNNNTLIENGSVSRPATATLPPNEESWLGYNFTNANYYDAPLSAIPQSSNNFKIGFYMKDGGIPARQNIVLGIYNSDASRNFEIRHIGGLGLFYQFTTSWGAYCFPTVSPFYAPIIGTTKVEVAADPNGLSLIINGSEIFRTASGWTPSWGTADRFWIGKAHPSAANPNPLEYGYIGKMQIFDKYNATYPL